MKLKLIFLFSLIIIGLVFSVFIKKPSKQNLPKKENVLGIEEGPQTLNFSKLREDINQISKEILNETTNYIKQTTSNMTSAAANNISSLIYDAAVKPIIDQIQRLPKNQQEKVKEQICK